MNKEMGNRNSGLSAADGDAGRLWQLEPNGTDESASTNNGGAANKGAEAVNLGSIRTARKKRTTGKRRLMPTIKPIRT